MTRALYICYFGLREPLVQSQVLPYLREISRSGVDMSLLTFEPDARRAWDEKTLVEWGDQLRGDGIKWHSLAYHQRPSLPATVYDVLAGAQYVMRLVETHGINVLHARSHIPLAIALLARAWTKGRLVFDFRGLMAEEYADAGVWREGSPKFIAIKRLERLGFRQADQIIVLTERMREWLIKNGLASAERIEVIPCCVDLPRFMAGEGDQTLPAADRFEVVYAGSVTGLYLLEEMGRFFLVLRDRVPRAFFRVMTNSSAEKTVARLSGMGLSTADFTVTAALPAEVPAYLRRARLGISFRKSSFSQIAASPTKVPEYLAAGLPVVCNAGIGDMDNLLERSGVGVVVRRFDSEAYSKAVEAAITLAEDPQLRSRCEQVVREHFDMTGRGGEGYRRVYRRLGEKIVKAGAKVA